ncbi:MAG: quaternary ammonium transporter [Ardenticatenales bacterium]|nr:quaternary ammonium transporter [Ardenticatenales bacterium]
MKRLSLFLALILVLALAACSGTQSEGTPAATPVEGGGEVTEAKGTLNVASKGFTEAFILGEMYALLLEENGYQVERKLGLGSESVIHEAMIAGDVDLYPEYTSTGLLAILQQPAMQDRVEIYNTVKAEYESQFKFTWLDAAPFNNTQALAVTQETSDEYGLTQVGQLTELAPQLRIGGAPEFYEREDGLPGLESLYGEMAFKEERQLDSGLRYEALLNDEIDVVVAYGTDGQIGGFDLVVLEDEKGLWPPYQVAPVVRQEVLSQHADIATILNPLAPLLTDQIMADLNWKVDGPDKMDFEDVARDFLIEKGLITQ